EGGQLGAGALSGDPSGAAEDGRRLVGRDDPDPVDDQLPHRPPVRAEEAGAAHKHDLPDGDAAEEAGDLAGLPAEAVEPFGDVAAAVEQPPGADGQRVPGRPPFGVADGDVPEGADEDMVD